MNGFVKCNGKTIERKMTPQGHIICTVIISFHIGFNRLSPSGYIMRDERVQEALTCEIQRTARPHGPELNAAARSAVAALGRSGPDGRSGR